MFVQNPLHLALIRRIRAPIVHQPGHIKLSQPLPVEDFLLQRLQPLLRKHLLREKREGPFPLAGSGVGTDHMIVAAENPRMPAALRQ
ncbi:hypothetical protein D3C75_1195050 [compost metagenome]